MRFPRLTVLALALAAAPATLPLWADDKKDPPVKAEETEALPETAAAAAEFDLARNLIEYGRAKKDPSSLVTAALILHRNPTEEIADLPEEAKKAALPAAKDLLAEARKFKPDDKGVAAVLDWADAELKVKERGSAGLKTFAGTKTLTVTIPFKAGEPASIQATALAHFPKTTGFPPKVQQVSGPAIAVIAVVGPGAPAAKTGNGTVGTSFMVPTSTTVKKGTPVPYKVTVTVTNGTSPTFHAHTN